LRSPQAGKLLPPGGILEDPEEKIWQKGEKNRVGIGIFKAKGNYKI
jgi:hypothetical protein